MIETHWDILDEYGVESTKYMRTIGVNDRKSEGFLQTIPEACRDHSILPTAWKRADIWIFHKNIPATTQQLLYNTLRKLIGVVSILLQPPDSSDTVVTKARKTDKKYHAGPFPIYTFWLDTERGRLA